VVEKLGRSVSRTTLRPILKKAGLSGKKSQKVLAKAKAEDRAEFVERFQGWFAQVCLSQVRLIYVDEVHLHQDLEGG